MKLIADLGNTLRKYAVFDGDCMVFLQSVSDGDAKILNLIFEKYRPDSGIVSSVVQLNEQYTQLFPGDFKLLNMSADLRLPLINRYASPQTLGSDRLAAAVAAYSKFPGENVLVVDAGTCIKYDMVHRTGEYLGGAISLGVNMRFSALHTFTGKLPLIKSGIISGIVGTDTRTSILSGVMNGATAEIDGMIGYYSEKFPGLRVVMSGGDAGYFAGKLKNRIFAVENVVLIGLKIILDYNDQ